MLPANNSISLRTCLFGLGRRVQRAALEFLYPPSCLLCHAEPRPDPGGDHQSFCEECIAKLTSHEENACRRCGAPAGPYTIAVDHCILCRRENFAFDEVIRLGLYRDELRIGCLISKNPAGALMGQALADLLVKARQKRFARQQFHAIVPIPEHWVKRLTRQQYAAETIAQLVSHRLNVPLQTHALTKAKWTPKQARSLPVQRRQQQKNAFRAAGNRVQGQSVLLVDDILTTGATADAAARELKRAGATRVTVAVLAVSPPRA